MSNEPETTLLLIRHGESVATVKGIMAGEKACEGLSELGRRQAATLRDRWARSEGPDVDVLVSSTLPRARETAEVLDEALRLGVELDSGLVEHRPGSLDGVAFVDLRERWARYDFAGRRHDRVAPGAETAAEFFFRVSAAVEGLLARHRGSTIAVVCHGGVIDAALRTLLDLPLRGHFDLVTRNVSVTELSVQDHGAQRGRWQLVRYNDHAHLAGLPAETPRTER